MKNVKQIIKVQLNQLQHSLDFQLLYNGKFKINNFFIIDFFGEENSNSEVFMGRENNSIYITEINII